MTEVFVGIGSNVRPEEHVRQAVKLMRERFGGLRLSPVYRTKAVGFEGDDFLNLVAAFDTGLAAAELNAALDEIELRCGRQRGAARFAPRTLDLDLLLHGERVDPALRLPRKEILQYAFVLKPLMELAGVHRHPESGMTYKEHWARFQGDRGGLTAVELPGL
ncbi:MAG TPA: 2-amino-4-hydroxy-6-hydroxymethyldihydropteridine diphosphokinase [Gammaproteobacteria bacterium]|nr:2-amino-4-hydroxy-6-hydroxymethyldihydropteridine diphosphokinase [Gammaproteobacteria bacterium]